MKYLFFFLALFCVLFEAKSQKSLQPLVFYFDSGEYQLKKEDRDSLSDFFYSKILKDTTYFFQAEIKGFCDTVGTVAQNYELSKLRVQSAQKVLDSVLGVFGTKPIGSAVIRPVCHSLGGKEHTISKEYKFHSRSLPLSEFFSPEIEDLAEYRKVQILFFEPRVGPDFLHTCVLPKSDTLIRIDSSFSFEISRGYFYYFSTFDPGNPSCELDSFSYHVDYSFSFKSEDSVYSDFAQELKKGDSTCFAYWGSIYVKSAFFNNQPYLRCPRRKSDLSRDLFLEMCFNLEYPFSDFDFYENGQKISPNYFQPDCFQMYPGTHQEIQLRTVFDKITFDTLLVKGRNAVNCYTEIPYFKRKLTFEKKTVKKLLSTRQLIFCCSVNQSKLICQLEGEAVIIRSTWVSCPLIKKRVMLLFQNGNLGF